jgi:hypothetical protein
MAGSEGEMCEEQQMAIHGRLWGMKLLTAANGSTWQVVRDEIVNSSKWQYVAGLEG